VTGAGRGIGRAIARKLASAGCDVGVNFYSSHREAAELCDEIRHMGRRALPLQASVADPQAVGEVMREVARTFEGLDILVSNAASGVLRPVLEMSLKHWRWCLETNAFALALLAQHAAPLLRPGASLVALSSLGAARALPGYGFVGASKAALEALVRSLAQELGPRRIRVNAVSAGPVDTDSLRAMPGRERLLAAFAERAPAGAPLTPEDVAGAVYLLCLPEASAITGQTLIADGGFSISG
jgi:enoyl-[acyl-carrier protein] reductase III